MTAIYEYVYDGMLHVVAYGAMIILLLSSTAILVLMPRAIPRAFLRQVRPVWFSRSDNNGVPL